MQLPWAGVEPYTGVIAAHSDRTWTCGKGVYAEPVAELALTLGLAGLRGLATYSRAVSWEHPQGSNLLGGRVTILGGGGITTSLVRLLEPFNCHITVVRRRAEDLPGVDDVLDPYVVVACGVPRLAQDDDTVALFRACLDAAQ